ncbi:polysaccharide biosynthesis/export family protein [Candidatus Methylacidithermus pantelleriae]|uniref:Soluble ligand binding domain-containing protein n=1 Tax=Candidatus Methylacidithermus pantelleriae TaxID=2744239 RepID=A0A8J2BQ96_9BACT|nr:polysaccharide biosynthesis/export family protein [Candidatus Methylacidithermus pantelleriae]CAF0703256.1 hypothetical protein MPNT_530002 [Candidatus Methylacidithermus pantelleriae]
MDVPFRNGWTFVPKWVPGSRQIHFTGLIHLIVGSLTLLGAALGPMEVLGKETKGKSPLHLSSREPVVAGKQTGSLPGYAVRPGDLLRIHVFQEDDLDTEARVSEDGTIHFPLLGRVLVAGKTTHQVAAILKELLGKDYLVNPQVVVSVLESEQKITILGQVQKPGAYALPLERPLNLLEAIAMAGGYTRLADPGRITVKRKEGGKEKVYRVNAKAMAHREVEPFTVLPDDIITVPESLF